MRTIKWDCQKVGGWEWRSAQDKPVPGLPDQQVGTITLAPNKEFWFLCGYLFLGETVGTAAIRYYKDNTGTDLVQVFTDARGHWHVEGQADPVASSTGQTGGGINLTAAFV